MEEYNQAKPECLNILYEISHPRKKKPTPYKYGKHSIYAPDRAMTPDEWLMLLKYKCKYNSTKNNNTLVFGHSGIGRHTTIQEYINKLNSPLLHIYIK